MKGSASLPQYGVITTANLLKELNNTYLCHYGVDTFVETWDTPQIFTKYLYQLPEELFVDFLLSSVYVTDNTRDLFTTPPTIAKIFVNTNHLPASAVRNSAAEIPNLYIASNINEACEIINFLTSAWGDNLFRDDPEIMKLAVNHIKRWMSFAEKEGRI